MKKLLLFWVFLLPVLGYSQCNSLRKTTDKFDGKIQIWTKILEPIVLNKVVNGDSITYFLSLHAPATALSDRKGAFILFADNTKMEWPDQRVECNYRSSHPRWDNDITAKSFIRLTSDQLQTVLTKRMTDVKLYIYTYEIRERLGEEFRKLAECLVNTKPEAIKED